MCDLAARLQLSPSGLTRRLDGLVRAGCGRAAAVGDRPAGDARRAHRRRLGAPRAGGPGPRRQRAPARHRPPRPSATSRRWRGSSPPSSAGARAAEPVTGLAPAGLRLPRRQRRRQGRHRRLRRRRRRSPGRRGRGVHPEPVRRPERDDQPGAPRRRAGPGRRRRVEERQRGQRPGGRRRRRGRSSPRSPPRLGCAPGDVLVASTGVIGRRYPIERLLAGVGGDALPARPAPTPSPRRRGIMTTDTVPKVAEAAVGDGPARVVGIAKGVGMIEPDMATMIAVLFTDADGRGRRARRARSGASSTARSTASASTPTRRPATPRSCWPAAPPAPVDGDELEAALGAVAESLTKQIARDGEGAADAHRGRRRRRPRPGARRSGWPRRSSTRRSSRRPCTAPTPTGAGWRWRSASARTTPTSTRTGSSSASATGRSTRRRSTTPSSPRCPSTSRGDEVRIHVSLGTGDAACTVWGCDLTDGYVRINADYTT